MSADTASGPGTTGTETGQRTADELVAEPAELDVYDPRLTRFDLVREGARRKGIEIVHYEPRFPPGSRADRRMERVVASLFLLAGAAGMGFVVAYIWWPWEYADGATATSKFYTPVLGVTLAISMLAIGAGITTWAKKLLPHEVSVEHRHDQPSSDTDRKIMGATLGNMLDETGVTRRPLLRRALLLGLAPIGLVAAAPLVGGLLKDPHTNRTGEPGFNASPQDYTGWNPALNDEQPVRLTFENGSPIRPADVSVGGQVTVFPGIDHGASNEYADSPTLLIHLREEFAAELRQNLYPMNQDSMAGNFVAYSKICTHAGCPPSLFEQQTNRLLCPCHQSQFLITDNARPIFGPATRSLAMLPIAVDNEGYFVATSDYQVPVGPSFWER
ncbi:MAG: Rieske 2Fe-2S domain-containing protein [Micromonosporaceae bacterium]|nr:Rieske 2Fe-2S domain-containing protein [Micromonosporaceae bacterium]